MKRWSRTPETLAAAIAVMMVFAVLSGLGGCASGDTPLGRIIESIGSGVAYPLPAEAEHELERFDAAYYQVAIDGDDQGQLRHFRDAFRRIRLNYVKPIDDHTLINAAIDGVSSMELTGSELTPRAVIEHGLDAMLASLDPHSSYLNPKEFEETQVSTSGQFGGLGIEIMLENETVKVVAPIEETPAAFAGVIAGDLITHVDGEDIQGKGLAYAVNLLRGEPGDPVAITIVREGVLQPFDLSIIRAVIKVRSVRWRREGDIGYIRVNRFTERVESGIVNAMNALRRDQEQEWGGNLTGIVLDLRNNPGGLLDQSIILADAFLEEGRIVSINSREENSERSYNASPGDMASGLPVVVLINGGSASASEIVAGALQDHGRAIIMGTRSFGKGSVQTISPLPVEGALRLTTALYYAPSGRSIQASGILPDIVLKREKTEEITDEATREVDLPHALSGAALDTGSGGPVIDVDLCPSAEDMDDPELACALGFLHATSTEAFLSSVGVRPPS